MRSPNATGTVAAVENTIDDIVTMVRTATIVVNDIFLNDSVFSMAVCSLILILAIQGF
jgi:hypothetical protein